MEEFLQSLAVEEQNTPASTTENVELTDDQAGEPKENTSEERVTRRKSMLSTFLDDNQDVEPKKPLEMRIRRKSTLKEFLDDNQEVEEVKVKVRARRKSTLGEFLENNKEDELEIKVKVRAKKKSTLGDFLEDNQEEPEANIKTRIRRKSTLKEFLQGNDESEEMKTQYSGQAKRRKSFTTSENEEETEHDTSKSTSRYLGDEWPDRDQKKLDREISKMKILTTVNGNIDEKRKEIAQKRFGDLEFGHRLSELAPNGSDNKEGDAVKDTKRVHLAHKTFGEIEFGDRLSTVGDDNQTGDAVKNTKRVQLAHKAFGEIEFGDRLSTVGDGNQTGEYAVNEESSQNIKRAELAQKTFSDHEYGHRLSSCVDVNVNALTNDFRSAVSVPKLPFAIDLRREELTQKYFGDQDRDTINQFGQRLSEKDKEDNNIDNNERETDLKRKLLARKKFASHQFGSRLSEFEPRKYGTLYTKSKNRKRRHLARQKFGEEKFGHRLSTTSMVNNDNSDHDKNTNLRETRRNQLAQRAFGDLSFGKRLSVINTEENNRSELKKKHLAKKVFGGVTFGSRLSIVNLGDTRQTNSSDNERRRSSNMVDETSTVPSRPFGSRLSVVKIPTRASETLNNYVQDPESLLVDPDFKSLQNNQEIKPTDSTDAADEISEVTRLLESHSFDTDLIESFRLSSISNINEAVKLSTSDLKQIGLKNFSERAAVQKLFKDAAQKPTKVLLSYAVNASTVKDSNVGKILNSLKLNFSKMLRDASTMTFDEIFEAVQNTDLLLLIISDEYFDPGSPISSRLVRIGALVSAFRNKIPIIATYMVADNHQSRLPANRLNKQVLKKIESLLKDLDSATIESLAQSNIEVEELYSAAERLSKVITVPESQLVNSLEKEIKKIQIN